MLRFAKVATPLTGLPIGVPESAPPPGLDPMASVTRLVAVVTTRPDASWIATCTAGVIWAPAVAALGWTRIASFAARPGPMRPCWLPPHAATANTATRAAHLRQRDSDVSITRVSLTSQTAPDGGIP